jgi:hypothetical protein
LVFLTEDFMVFLSISKEYWVLKYAIIIIHNQHTNWHMTSVTGTVLLSVPGRNQQLACNIPWPTFYLLLFTLLKVFKFSSQLLLCWKNKMSDKFQRN